MSLGQGTEDTRRRVTVAELGSDPAMARSVAAYGGARLLTFDRDPASSEPTVEVSHEAVIREWPRLRGWLAEDREGLRMQHHLTASAAAWDDQGRDDGELYRGLRLSAVERWSEATVPVLTPVEVEFLGASSRLRDEEEAAERARLRRLRRLVVVAGAIAVVAIVAGLFAFREQRRADDQATRAEENATLASTNAEQAQTSAELADERATEAEDAREQGDIERLRAVARASAAENPPRAALLAVEAYLADPSIEGLDSLHRVLTETPGSIGFAPGGPYVAGELLGDGKTLVALGVDQIDVWDVENRVVLRTIDHPVVIGTPALAVTPDGRTAAIRGGSAQTFFYDLTTGATLGSIVHDTPVSDLSLSAEGSLLVAARVDGRVGLWDTNTLTRTRLFDISSEPVRFARWSPTELRFTAVTQQAVIQFWDPDGTDPVWSSTPEPGTASLTIRPNSLTYSPDGTGVVVDTGTFEATTSAYDTRDGSLLFSPTPRGGFGAGAPIDSMLWLDADGWLVATPTRLAIEAFDLETGDSSTLIVQVQDVLDVAFSPELNEIVSIGRKGLGFWSLDQSGPLERVVPFSTEQADAYAEHGGVVYTSLALDGSQIITSVVAFPAAPPALTVDLTADELTTEVFREGFVGANGYGEFTVVAAVPTGTELVDATGEPLGPPVPFSLDHSDSRASHDGRFLAIARLGGFADLYTGSGELIANLDMALSELEQSFVGLSFNGDASLIAATTFDNLAVWETDTLERLDLERQPNWGWTRLVGDELIITATDGTLLRVDPRTGQETNPPLLTNTGAGNYALDTANNRLASLGEVVRVWDLDSGKQIGRGLPMVPIQVEFTGDGSLLSVATEDRVTL
ncbi:MAG: hypothetical protein ACR2PK_02890, partial [Acidimicrobiales bacterium]